MTEPVECYEMSLDKIIAGSTLNLSGGGESVPDNTWSSCESSCFNLRVGPDYSYNKKKAASPPAIMDIVGVE
jgi:hypothetical protein